MLRPEVHLDNERGKTMKKVLFATTALVASAGFAAADITFEGSAELGVVGGGEDAPGVSSYTGENAGGYGSNVVFNNDFTLTVKATGETDTGLQFGVNVDFSTQAEPDENGNVALDNEDAYLKGAFGELHLGEIDGAVDKRLTEVNSFLGQASLGDDETVHAGFQGAYGDGAYDNQILRYDYDFGAFGVSVSMELDDTDTVDNGYAIGGSYKGEMGGVDLRFGLGYQFVDSQGDFAPGNLNDFTGFAYAVDTDVDIVGVTAGVGFSGFKVGLEYTSFDGDDYDTIDHYAVGLGYTFEAFSVGLNYEAFDGGDINDSEGWGLTAGYDLGGGVSLLAGYSDSDIDDMDGDYETYSFGVAMEF